MQHIRTSIKTRKTVKMIYLNNFNSTLMCVGRIKNLYQYTFILINDQLFNTNTTLVIILLDKMLHAIQFVNHFRLNLNLPNE